VVEGVAAAAKGGGRHAALGAGGASVGNEAAAYFAASDGT